MDLREKKTLRAIRTAFLQLRGQRPLEKITVKELCELADTFAEALHRLKSCASWRIPLPKLFTA